MSTKICIICKEEKQLDEFWWHSKKNNERLPRCIPCAKLQPSYLKKILPPEERKSGHRLIILPECTMICVKCKETKPLNQYAKTSLQCKSCLAEYLRIRRKTLVRERTLDPQICKRCLVLKEASNFKTSKESKNGIRRVCIDCDPVKTKPKPIES